MSTSSNTEINSRLMRLTLKRVRQGKKSTLSELYRYGIFQCYVLEDSVRDTKVKGQTCIPMGVFKLGLNYWGGMNTAYKKRFPEMHQGMIEIKDIPNFNNVYMHIGNTHEDTSGCLLVGTYFHRSSDADDFEVYQSAQAYQELYKAIIEKVKRGEVNLHIEHAFMSKS